MKIGIFGGAFNPIHLGHLITVNEVREHLNLDKILFIPTFDPPHKQGLIDYQHRRNMVRLAIRNNPDFELCEIEKTKQGVSWTIDTLKILHRQYPQDMLFLIMGSDQYVKLNRWKEPGELTKYAKIVVMHRPGNKILKPKLRTIFFINISQIDIVGTEIRKAISHNKSVRYKIPDNVKKYIEKNKLYK